MIHPSSDSYPARSGRKQRVSSHVDMTPMVDLAFLLLTFFVLAAVLSKPMSIELVYPETNGDPTPLNERLATTVLLGEEKLLIAYYHGLFNEDTTQIHYCDMSELRKMLLELNSELSRNIEILRGKMDKNLMSEAEYRDVYRTYVSAEDNPFVIVKTLPGTPYASVIETIDELNIASIRKRSVQDMTLTEAALMRKSQYNLGH